MPTKKTTTKKKPTPRYLTKAEYDKFFNALGKARVIAFNIQKDPKYAAEVRRAFASIEKKLWNIGNDYYWWRLTNYER